MNGGAGLRMRLRDWFGKYCFCSTAADNRSGLERERIGIPHQTDNKVMRADGLTQGKREVRRKVEPREKLKGMPVSIGG